MTPTKHGKMDRVGLGEEQGQAGELLPSTKGKLLPAEIPVARPMPPAMAVFSEEQRRDRQPVGLWENWCCQYSKTGAMSRRGTTLMPDRGSEPPPKFQFKASLKYKVTSRSARAT